MSNIHLTKFFLLLSLCFMIGCEKQDQSIDGGFSRKNLKDLKAGIWIDPNGCQHWIIDDGVEGYLSQRLLRNGKPLCMDTFTPNVAIGGFNDGETFLGDLL